MQAQTKTVHHQTSQGLERYLFEIGKMIETNGHRPDSFYYKSLEQFVLVHGRSYTAADLPPGVNRMEPKNCYQNALDLAMDSDYIYVEGFGQHIIPMLHAWCVEAGTNRVVDPTWPHPPSTVLYYGVPFRKTWVRKIVGESGWFGVLDNWREEYPILRQELDVSCLDPRGFADE